MLLLGRPKAAAARGPPIAGQPDGGAAGRAQTVRRGTAASRRTAHSQSSTPLPPMTGQNTRATSMIAPAPKGAVSSGRLIQTHADHSPKNPRILRWRQVTGKSGSGRTESATPSLVGISRNRGTAQCGTAAASLAAI